jgi:hypothetical protein
MFSDLHYGWFQSCRARETVGEIRTTKYKANFSSYICSFPRPGQRNFSPVQLSSQTEHWDIISGLEFRMLLVLWNVEGRWFYRFPEEMRFKIKLRSSDTKIPISLSQLLYDTDCICFLHCHLENTRSYRWHFRSDRCVASFYMFLTNALIFMRHHVNPLGNILIHHFNLTFIRCLWLANQNVGIEHRLRSLRR